MSNYIFKTADTDSEKMAVHRLNYRTFVEEIPQHQASQKKVLVDRFDDENTYIIAIKDQNLVGMLAVRGNRPFSLDLKLNNIENYLPCHNKLCEVRLLSVVKDHRNGVVFKGLMYELLRYVNAEGYDLAVISGTTRQIKLYSNMGFVPFGPVVGKDGALFQPMYLCKKTFMARLRDMTKVAANSRNESILLNFLPGPVTIRSNVKRAFCNPPISHRSEAFIARMQDVKKRLTELTGARTVEVLLGSGTLANDAIAWQIKQLNKPGLVLTAGEFGDRLVDHAHRAGLDFQAVCIKGYIAGQGDFFRKLLEQHPEVCWLWTVHCETSTGAMVDIQELGRLCKSHRVKLCVDAISTFGIMSVELDSVYFASAVSGKAVGGYPGLAMVFYSHTIKPPQYGIPRYLDLYAYAKNAGVPYTHSSNLLEALAVALDNYPETKEFSKLATRASWLRNELTKMGCDIITPNHNASPAVVTFTLPSGISSQQFGEKMADNGCLLSYQSGYLIEQNMVQICMMSPTRTLGQGIKSSRGFLKI